jgi:CheY-like chemotaxis protein
LTSTVGATSKPRVLWLEDEPAFLQRVRKLLSAAKMSLEIDECTSPKEAEVRLQSGAYAALVADYRLDKTAGPGENGANLLVRAGQLIRAIPKFVYSAYVHDAQYSRIIEGADVVKIGSKLDQMPSSGLDRDPFFRALHQCAHEFEGVRTVFPEKIAYRDYLKAPSTFEGVVDSHWVRHKHWILPELQRRGYVWGVVCGQGLVKGSPDIFDFPGEKELDEIGNSQNLLPFAYSNPLPVESIGSRAEWAGTRYENDHFPRVSIRIDDLHIEDFDTGAIQTHVSDDLVRPGLFERTGWTIQEHLGREFQWKTKRIVLTLLGHDGSVRQAEVPVRVVKKWENSPFVHVNPERKILVGRDILRAFKVEIVLNSLDRSTEVRFLD